MTPPYAGRWRQCCLTGFLIALVAAMALPLWESVERVTVAQESTPASDGSADATDPDGDGLAAQAPAIFSDDFEAFGDSSLWARNYPFEVSEDIVANGAFAARLTNVGGTPEFGRKTLERRYSSMFLRLRFQPVEVKDGPVTLVQFRENATSPILSIQIDSTGHISFLTESTAIASTSVRTVESGRWHELQVYVNTATTDRNVRVWLDDAELSTMRQDVFLGKDKTIEIIQLGDNTGGVQSDIAFDDIVVDDSFIAPDRQAEPVPGRLLARAVPPRDGIEFELDGETFVTDDEGVARIQVRRWSTDLRSRIDVHPRAFDDGSVASFTGWRNWISPQTREVVAVFRLSQPVTFSFVDPDGVVVDPSLIDTLIIKSNTGDIHALSASDLADTTLLTASIVTTPSGLHLKNVTYYVDQVIIDGANVVNRSQQRTTFERSRNWQISLLFFGVKFRAVDALFGTPLGKEILIEAADGSQQTLALDDHGEVVIPRLPRGEYAVSVLGAGYSPPRPIMVSRSQAIDLEVISKLDVLLVLSFAGCSVLGLLIIGRPFLVVRPWNFLRTIVTTPATTRWRGGT